jgi:hypothetical protein
MFSAISFKQVSFNPESFKFDGFVPPTTSTAGFGVLWRRRRR